MCVVGGLECGDGGHVDGQLWVGDFGSLVVVGGVAGGVACVDGECGFVGEGGDESEASDGVELGGQGGWVADGAVDEYGVGCVVGFDGPAA